MINETIVRIEGLLRDSALPQTERETLLTLLRELRQELSEVAAGDAEQAASVASFTEVATREALRRDIDPDLLEHATSGLAKSLHRVGNNHPGLARVVGQLCDFLSSTGI